MPLTAVHCAAPKYRKKHVKHEVSLQDCLDCAFTRENTCHFTYELLSSMFATQQDRGARITTTTLTSTCLRSEFLKRFEPFAEEPEKMWASFRGTMYHGQLEAHAADGCIEEPRYHASLDLGHFSGSPDLLDVKHGKLYDYKVTKEVPKYQDPWSNHVAQNNINRWLVDHAEWVEYRGLVYLLEGYAKEEATDFASLAGKRLVTDVVGNRATFRPQSWSELVVVYMDDKGPKPMVCTKRETVPLVSGEGTKVRRVPHIWSDQECEEFIWSRYAEAVAAFEGGELPPIPENMVGWEHPLCNWCPKKNTCIELHYQSKVPALAGAEG